MTREAEGASIVIDTPRVRERLTKMINTTLPADAVGQAEKYVARLQKKARARFELSDLYREILEQTRTKLDVEHGQMPPSDASEEEWVMVNFRVAPGLLDAYREMADRLQTRKLSDREISPTGLIQSVLIAGIRSLTSSP